MQPGRGERGRESRRVVDDDRRPCLSHLLRSRGVRREVSLEVHVPDPVISPEGERGPEEEALLADSVGLALQVVLDALAPSERLAFVLHDMFELPFEEIAPMVGRSPATARQLASRARRRSKEPHSTHPTPTSSANAPWSTRSSWRPVVATSTRWLPSSTPTSSCEWTSARRPAASSVVHGAAAVARQARLGANPAAQLHPALVNGAAGVVITLHGRAHVVMAFTVAEDQVVEIDMIADPDRVRRVASAVLTIE